MTTFPPQIRHTSATNDPDNDLLLHNHARHELPLLLTQDGSQPTNAPDDDDDDDDDDCFAARLLQVVQQQHNTRQGLDLSNLVKKWNQVWPDVPFPARRQGCSLQQWLRAEASHIVTIRADDTGVLRLHPIMGSLSSAV